VFGGHEGHYLAITRYCDNVRMVWYVLQLPGHPQKEDLNFGVVFFSGFQVLPVGRVRRGLRALEVSVVGHERSAKHPGHAQTNRHIFRPQAHRPEHGLLIIKPLVNNITIYLIFKESLEKIEI
jgi:hypothetical protein